MWWVVLENFNLTVIFASPHFFGGIIEGSFHYFGNDEPPLLNCALNFHSWQPPTARVHSWSPPTVVTTTTRVEVVGKYTFRTPFQADSKEEEVLVDRLPTSLLFTTDRSISPGVLSALPSNWNSFCDADDAVLMPLTVSKTFHVTPGKVSCTVTFYTSFACPECMGFLHLFGHGCV